MMCEDDLEDLVNELKTQLSSKERERDELKTSVNNFTEMYQEKCNENASLRKRCEDLEAALRESLPWAIGSGHGISEELEMRCQKLLSQ